MLLLRPSWNSQATETSHSFFIQPSQNTLISGHQINFTHSCSIAHY